MLKQLGILNDKKKTSMLELMAIAILLAFVAGILLDRLLFYQEAAEKARMEYEIGSLKSALRLRMANMLMEGRVRDFVRLAEENPFAWLDQKPTDYEPDFPGYSEDWLRPGTWYYDSRNKVVLYVPMRTRHFRPDEHGHRWVKLKVELTLNQRAEKDASEPRIVGVNLIVVEPYQWL